MISDVAARTKPVPGIVQGLFEIGTFAVSPWAGAGLCTVTECSPVGSTLAMAPIGPGGLSGYTRHGLMQAIGREGVGVHPTSILDALRNPLRIIRDAARGSTKMVGSEASVVLSEEGKVITVYGRPRVR